jgi:hypothetical protein
MMAAGTTQADEKKSLTVADVKSRVRAWQQALRKREEKY